MSPEPPIPLGDQAAWQRAADVLRLRGYSSYILRRLLGFVPLLLGISLVAFFLVRLLPGDPARVLAGNTPYEGTVEAIREHLGLTKPLPEQYAIYLQNIASGDLGSSYITGQPVLSELSQRLPATLELITFGLLVAVLIGVVLGIVGALNPGRIVDRFSQLYGFLAGSIPDFWLALLVILVLFHEFRVVPAPLARLPLAMEAPPTVTGFYTIDSVVAGDIPTLSAALVQLFAPALTLSLLNAPLIAKITRSSMVDVLNSDYIRFARACGLSKWTIARYAFQNVLPPFMTMVGFLYAFLIGGAVLVEYVFSWPGIGSYAVRAVANRDYLPLQGFVLVMGTASLIVYLIVDVAYMLVDPRVRLGKSSVR